MKKKRAKREQLLNAGLTLLMNRPADKISMDDVAAEAGVTKPMVYYYFGSKLGFYEQLVEYTANSLQKMLQDCLEPDISFRELLQRIINARIDQLVTRPELSNAVRIMATRKTIGGAESRTRIVAIFNHLQPIFNQAVKLGEIRKDVDLHLIMALVNSLLDGVVRIHGKQFFDSETSFNFADMLIRLVFDGVGTGKRS
ncbi:MAG: TetR/AcrR family transcriptional regulator [Candidatus Fermentibacteria bacterium]|nr:TetR/AcrR family transcriptional regulator [Candidatus Fermentibacteria bacterium]